MKRKKYYLLVVSFMFSTSLGEVVENVENCRSNTLAYIIKRLSHS